MTMWAPTDNALTHWNAGRIIPKTVLYYYDGPTVFTADIGLTEFLFHKFDEGTNSELFLIAPVDSTTVQALKDKALSVRGALADSPHLWIVDLAPNHEVRRFWRVEPSNLDPEIWPDEGLAIVPTKAPAADFVEQAISFFSTRFTGEALTPTTIPFMRFKTLIDSAYDSFRKIFPAPVIENRSLGRSLDFSLMQPKFSSLIIAIDRPVVDLNDVRKYIKKAPNDWDAFSDGFEKNRQDFFDRMNELVIEAEKGEIKKAYAIEHFMTLDQVNEIVPTSHNELDRVEFRTQTPSLTPIAIDDRIGTKLRIAYKIAERAPRTKVGAIVEINEAAGTMIIRDEHAREITCRFERKDYEGLNVAIGEKIRVHGFFRRRPRRDLIFVTSPPQVVKG